MCTCPAPAKLQVAAALFWLSLSSQLLNLIFVRIGFQPPPVLQLLCEADQGMQGVAAGGGQPQPFSSVSQPCMAAGMLCWLGLGGVFVLHCCAAAILLAAACTQGAQGQ